VGVSAVPTAVSRENIKPGIRRDRRRDVYFSDLGYRVLRFNTGQLSDSFDGCIEEILRTIGRAIAAPAEQGE